MLGWRSPDRPASPPLPVDRTDAPPPSTAAAAPGVAFVGAVAGVAWLLGGAAGVAPLVAGIVAGFAAGNLGAVPPACWTGIRWAGRHLLRAGVVLLGLRLSLAELAELGVGGAIAVVAGVVTTFGSTRWLARRLDVSAELGLLVATGYAVCGASAIAAVEGVTDADEEDVAFAIGLVTLFGSLSIVVLPAVAEVAGLDPGRFGAWTGAAVHDVGQVVATASTAGAPALTVAIVVKLCRVVLLAPIVAAISARRAQRDPGRAGAPVPAFVVGFLATAAVRSTDVLPAAVLATGRRLETTLLCAAMVALGCGVRVTRLRRLGARPIALGLVAWIVVAGAALAVAHAVPVAG